MNSTTFFAYARRAPFGGKLSTAQVEGLNAILKACAFYAVTDKRWIAYILATAFHETGGTMQPIREAFAKSDAQAVSRLEAAWKAGKLGQVKKPYWREGWFGRGYVQLTHLANYVRMGQALGLDLVRDPGLMMKPNPAAKAIVLGMRDGMFTGKKLRDYFGGTIDDAVGARRVVNGTDKAKLIAGYHKNFLDALEAAATEQQPDVRPEDAKPDDVPVSQSGSAGTVAISTAGAVGASLIAAIQSPWALAALALLLVAAGVGAWLVFSGRLTINRGKAA